MSGGGSKPGERRGGRRAGTQNKITRDLKEIAQLYTREAIEATVKIMRAPRVSASVRLQAIEKILERGHGKPSQAHHLSGAVAVGSYDLSKLPDDELDRAYEILSRAAAAPLGIPGGDSEA